MCFLEKKMDEQTYREHPTLSYSDLVWLDKSPQHFFNRDKLAKETEAMRLGTLLHLGVLEPERFKNSYAIEPEYYEDGTPINRRVKAHREFLDGWRQVNKDKITIRPEELDSIIGMLTSIGMHKYACQLFTGGNAEVTGFGEYDGVPIKGKADYIIPNHARYGRVGIDLKKTQDASRKGFSRSIWNYRYQLQAAIYCKIFKLDNFIWVAVEDTKNPNFAPIGIYRAHETVIEKGEEKLKFLINLYKHCEKNKEWYGYTNGVEDGFLPSWVASEEGDSNG